MFGRNIFVEDFASLVEYFLQPYLLLTHLFMMRAKIFLFLGLLVTIILVACIGQNDFDREDNFELVAFDQTIQFEQKISAYDLFQGRASDLIPNNDFHLVELSSPLFTDYAYKQRLIKLPNGEKIEKDALDRLEFPNGTILAKTFFYYHDDRDTSLGKRIIETRLLIKEASNWNAATYVWNNEQSDASLINRGAETEVSWINTNGRSLSTLYRVPTQNDCGTCHQSNNQITPLGPTLMNLNRIVSRKGADINQLKHLQNVGLLNEFVLQNMPTIVDYKDINIPLDQRGRAYLAMNCAHCHNPDGWNRSSERRFDFSFETPLSQTGILYKKEKISRTMANGRMPFKGTTMLDEEGLELIQEYLRGL